MSLFQLPVAIQTNRIKSPGVQIYYPSVTGLKKQRVEQHINQMIYHTVQQLYKEQLQYQHGSNLEMIGHYELKTNERGILSLTFSNYAYSYPMAHGMTLVKSLTFNTITGKRYELADLFKSGSPYVARLTDIVNEQVKKRNIPVLNPGIQPVREDQDYYLADKTLVLYYQLYEITPYYFGLPMFPISAYELQSDLNEEGPLGILSASIA